MITENEFSLVTDLASVKAAQAVLQKIPPNFSHDCIPESEWQEVLLKLAEWEDRLKSLIYVEDSDQDDGD